MSAIRTAKDSSERLSPSFDSYGGAAPRNYELYFVPAVAAPLAVDLVAAASLTPGENVLDLACGTGGLRGLRPSVWAQRRSMQQT